MSEELKPCPFCGQQDAFVEQLDSDASVVICQGMVDEHSACLARGPVGVQQSDMEDQPGRDAAVAEWNRRAQPAEAEGVRDYRAEFSEGEVEAGTAIDELQSALTAVTAERDRLQAALDDPEYPPKYSRRLIEQLRAEVEALRAFGNEMVSAAFWGGSFDCGDIQDIAVKHGLLRVEQREAECGDACACSEYGFPSECYRKTELLGVAALAAKEAIQ